MRQHFSCLSLNFYYFPMENRLIRLGPSWSMSSPYSNAQQSEEVKHENTVGPGVKTDGSLLPLLELRACSESSPSMVCPASSHCWNPVAVVSQSNLFPVEPLPVLHAEHRCGYGFAARLTVASVSSHRRAGKTKKPNAVALPGDGSRWGFKLCWAGHPTMGKTYLLIYFLSPPSWLHSCRCLLITTVDCKRC